MEMLELSILRSHAYLALVDRDHLQLMYADRSAIVTTGIIDLTTTEGEAMFLAMQIAFHRFTPEQWGFLPLVNNAFSLEPSGDIAYHRDKDSSTVKRDCLKNLTLSLQKKSRKIPLRLTLQEILYHQPGIIGRGTCVIGASCEDVKEWEKWELAVKVSWPSKTRRSLRKCGNFDEAEAISEEAKDLVEESKTHWALNHLPNILYSEDFDLDSEKKPMPQEKLALFLATADIINGAFKYEPRVLRVSVQEKLHRFTTLPTLLDYAQAFLDVFICHRWLYDCPRILHRDISSGNIMYRIIEGKIYGVLNDLDLSSLRESVEQGVQTSLQRTGTPPYMAIELLQDDCDNPHPILHLYRHDLESLAYVLLLLCSRNKFNPDIRSIERLQQSPFDNWFDPALSWNGLAESKRNYLQGRLSISTKVHPSFQDFIPWIQSLLFAFADGFEAKRKWEKNTERFGGLLKEGPSTKWEAGSLLNRTLRGRGPVTKKVQKPAPFKEETLGGQVVYLSLLRSLSNFAGNPLVYRDFDIREENSADGDLLYS
ncbi:hypothetical protein BDZ94DRAFT_1256112 [Collybia nuda]|uniref:Protein kinase domain-containing protein n=1 Tax=Collybia nuda TaxID=64659 RepID=A0A9P5Y9E8_9AGAR|nr:hypothetical protein BDZ94DRAFT_1256112 [Collybia nuda]